MLPVLAGGAAWYRGDPINASYRQGKCWRASHGPGMGPWCTMQGVSGDSGAARAPHKLRDPQLGVMGGRREQAQLWGVEEAGPRDATSVTRAVLPAFGVFVGPTCTSPGWPVGYWALGLVPPHAPHAPPRPLSLCFLCFKSHPQPHSRIRPLVSIKGWGPEGCGVGQNTRPLPSVEHLVPAHKGRRHSASSKP